MTRLSPLSPISTAMPVLLPDLLTGAAELWSGSRQRAHERRLATLAAEDRRHAREVEDDLHAREVADRQHARRAALDTLLEQGRQALAAGAHRSAVRERYLAEARALEDAAERYHDRVERDARNASVWLASAEACRADAATLRAAALEVPL